MEDDLAPLMRRAFSLCGEDFNLDGPFYRQNLRPVEYETLLDLAFSTLRYAETVLVNAPFGREVRDPLRMRQLKERAGALDAQLILVWVSAPLAVCHARMQARNADRDRGKLADWEAYASGIDYSPPQILSDAGSVDRLMIFDNTDLQTAGLSLSRLLKMLEEDSQWAGKK